MIVWALVREWAAWHFTLLRFVSCWILVWPHFTSLLLLFPSLDCEILPIMWRLWLWLVCVGGDRSCVTQLSFVASPQGHWPVKKYPWNHETMRVITYSGVAGGPLMEVSDLKHPSSTRNIKEPRFKIGELWTILGNSKRRQQSKRGVPRMDKHGAVLSAKRRGAVKREQKKNARTKKWPVCSIPFHLKTVVKPMRRPHTCFWLMILLFSLCPESASSQVQNASRKYDSPLGTGPCLFSIYWS